MQPFVGVTWKVQLKYTLHQQLTCKAYTCYWEAVGLAEMRTARLALQNEETRRFTVLGKVGPTAGLCLALLVAGCWLLPLARAGSFYPQKQTQNLQPCPSPNF
jgi:hypothetical protein